MEFSEEQKQIIETDKKEVVVNACAASGKTSCLVARIQYLLERGTDPTSIVAITFTNAAAAEMKTRIKNGEGVFIGTVHSYCNYLLRKNGIKTDRLLDEEEFDELFPLIEKYPQIQPKIDYLIVDEFQDSDSIQYRFFFDFLKPKNWMVFGDPRQSIYSFKGSEPKLMIDLSKKPTTTVYQMTQNYRNSYRVLNLAKSYALKRGRDYQDISISMRGVEGKTDFFQDTSLKKSLQHFNFEKPQDWFVLARTNQQVDLLKSLLDQRGIPNVILRKADLNSAQLAAVLKSEKVIISTVHQSKGLERNKVIAFGLYSSKGEEINLCYVAITRARNEFYWIKQPRRKRI